MEDIRGIIRDLGEIREKACDLTEKMASKAREEGIADDLRAVKEKTGDIKAKFKTLKEDASKWEIRKNWVLRKCRWENSGTRKAEF